MNNTQVIKNFLQGGEGHTQKRKSRQGEILQTLHIEKKDAYIGEISYLYNYNTVIATLMQGEKLKGNIIVLDTHKYSTTTSKIQKQLINLLNEIKNKSDFMIQFLNERQNEFASILSEDIRIIP